MDRRRTSLGVAGGRLVDSRVSHRISSGLDAFSIGGTTRFDEIISGAAMKVVLGILRELFLLFVEDGTYAASIVLWLLVSGFILPQLLPHSLLAPALFVGLLILLFENVVRCAALFFTGDVASRYAHGPQFHS